MEQIKLEFLGYEKDQCRTVAAHLLEKFPENVAGVNDFSRVLVLLPGRSAVRQISTCLGNVFPPVFRTPGTLFEKNGERTDAEEWQIWQNLLKSEDLTRYSTIFPAGFRTDDPILLRNLAEQMYQLRSLLADNLLSMADAAGVLAEKDIRWLELKKLEQLYLEQLANVNLTDPLADLRAAVCDMTPFRNLRHIVLAGLPDLPRPVRILLDHISAELPEIQIHAFVFAPEKHRPLFDEYGCVKPEKWCGYSLPADKAELHVAHDPAAMAALVKQIMTADGVFEPDRCRIAVTGRKFAPWLEREMGALCPYYDPSGISAGKLRIVPFLRILAELSENSEVAASTVRALLAHPDALRFLAGKYGQDDLLKDADEYFTEHLPETIRRNSPVPKGAALAETFRKILDWRDLLRNSAGAAETVRVMLESVWQADFTPPPKLGVPFAEEAECIRKILNLFEHSPVLRSLPCRDFLPALVQEAERMACYPLHASDAVELSGFLELPFLTAEQLILCGMNEGIIPESLPPSPWLSDKKRACLGLPDNAARYARDCFYMDRLLMLYPGIHLISCRTDENGTPLRFPSFYFTGADDAALCRRVQTLFAAETASAPPPETDCRFRLKPDFSNAFLDQNSGKTKLSVTDFGEILKSPVRAFFSRWLHMEELDTEALEMDDRMLGTLCHEALEKYDAFSGTDALTGQLYHAAAERFGTPLPMTVRFQCEMLEPRLRKTEELLAEEITFGVKVLATEWKLNDGKGILFRDILIRGTIDRIEYKNGELRLIDFKTQGHRIDPETAHYPAAKKRKGKEPDPEDGIFMKNLQLPLYAMLLRRDPVFQQKFPEFDMENIRITCGYFCITKAQADIGYAMWDNMGEYLPLVETTIDLVLENIRLLRAGIANECPEKKVEYDGYETVLKPDLRSVLDGVKWVEEEECGNE